MNEYILKIILICAKKNVKPRLYRYLTTPQWYGSGDGYTRRYDEIVADIQLFVDKTKCVGRHATVVIYDRWELLPGGSRAGYNVAGMESFSTQRSSSSAHTQWTLQTSGSPWVTCDYARAIWRRSAISQNRVTSPTSDRGSGWSIKWPTRRAWPNECFRSGSSLKTKSASRGRRS